MDKIKLLQGLFPNHAVTINKRGTITLRDNSHTQKSSSRTKKGKMDVTRFRDLVADELLKIYGRRIKLGQTTTLTVPIFQFRPGYCEGSVHLELGQWPKQQELSIDFHVEKKDGNTYNKSAAFDLVNLLAEFAKENGLEAIVYNDDEKHLYPRISLIRLASEADALSKFCQVFDLLDQFFEQGKLYNQLVNKVYK